MIKQSRNEYLYEVIEKCINNLSSEHHAVYEHMYKTDEQLKTRCAVEKTEGASCFNAGTDIIEVVSDIIYDSVEILPWLANKDAADILRLVVASPNCGRKFLNSGRHNWKDGAIICNEVVVFLKKISDKCGCVTRLELVTVYPR